MIVIFLPRFGIIHYRNYCNLLYHYIHSLVVVIIYLPFKMFDFWEDLQKNGLKALLNRQTFKLPTNIYAPTTTGFSDCWNQINDVYVSTFSN